MALFVLLLAVLTQLRPTVAQQSVPCPITGVNKCVCTAHIVDCNNHGLSNTPPLSSSSEFTSLELSNNSLTVIQAASFAGLNLTNLDLSMNKISSVENNAFSGISNQLKRLDLSHNNLRFLPNAIGYLTTISELDVRWNPMPGYSGGRHGTDGLTDSVMRSIGNTIKVFKFGDAMMTSWPQSLNHFNRLAELVVAGVNIPYWPPNAFHGFEQTLKKLTIENLPIGSVPYGIAGLRHLEELHLDNLLYPFGDSSLVSLPFTELGGTLKVLSLKNDSLTTFPEGIKQLTSLQELYLDGNNLDFVSDEAISLLKTANVTLLSLRNCALKRVPGEISDLRNLETLDLSENLIRSIESTDLQNLHNLHTLRLNANPLLYISDNSLCGLDNLRDFFLQNTYLTEMSVAFKNMRRLHKLDLSGSHIDCTCDLTWVKSWIQKCRLDEGTPEIEGDCETIDNKLMTYVNSRLPNCPGFHEDDLVFSCTGTCIEH
ncbi:uncharacterized protein LOC128218928 [Mya arenaria]|uniref:uncharacterized protein LOC128218928 n=1 Tax=Mya arenaria TaxID=6604 RepID=UPI0022E912A3|nr:uncharacterized protein LOC128218928 [Mya arenaria]